MSSLLILWKSFVGPTPAVVDLTGRGSSGSRDLLDLVRAVTPGARFFPPPLIRPDRGWLEAEGLRRIDALLVDDVAALAPWREFFAGHRVDAVLFRGDPQVAAILRYHQFNIGPARFSAEDARQWNSGSRTFELTGPDQDARSDLPFLAVHHRMIKQPRDPNVYVDVEALFRQYSLEARGVVHVGANTGQELALYQRMGFKKIVFIEANPAVYARLAQTLKSHPNATGVLCAISDRNGLEILHVTSSDESSSLLPLKKHLEHYPGIRETGQILVSARRLDHLLREINQDPADFNYLHLDIQGAELKALSGAPELLGRLDALCTEVNYEELYEGCPLVEDLDDFLGDYRFERVFTSSNPRRWGDAFYVRQPAVSMRTLGQWGRFGNQVFEYAFLKIFGREHRLRVETPHWIGNQLFGADDPPVRRQYPQHAENTYALKDSQVAFLKTRPGNIDLRGVFQYHTSYYAPHRDYFRSLFQPVPALKAALDRAIATAKAARNAHDVVVLHLRRGDYGYGTFFIPPNAWYLDLLRTLWPSLQNPLLYLATDEPAKVLPDFAEFQPLTAADLKLPSYGADYYTDFYLMTQADALAISNSTFSFAAAMLNSGTERFWRPDLFAGKLLPFDPWNAEPLLHRELGLVDYRVVDRVAREFRQRTNDLQLTNVLRHYRAQLADSFTQLRPDQLQLVLHGREAQGAPDGQGGDLWTCYRILRGTILRLLPLLPQERSIVASIRTRYDAALARGAGEALGPFIAATLYDPVTNLPPPPFDLATLPPAIADLLRAP